MNNNISVRNNQAFFKDPLNIAYWLGGSMPAMFVPEHLSTKIFTKARMLMTQELFRHMNMHDAAFPSHTTLAKAAGLKRQAAYEYFKWAEEIGLFKVMHRGKSWESNIYFLGDVLKIPSVRWALRHAFKGLHRVFMKTVKVLHEAANIAKRTLLLNNNVFKINTSNSSYREKRLYSTPFLKKEYWLNLQKQLWSDWSVREIDLHMQREERENMYKQWVKPRKEEPKQPIISKDINSISADLMNERIRMCKKEIDIDRRLAMYDKLKTQVDSKSVAYIEYLIKETKNKLKV